MGGQWGQYLSVFVSLCLGFVVYHEREVFMMLNSHSLERIQSDTLQANLQSVFVGKMCQFLQKNGKKKIVIVASTNSCTSCYRDDLLFFINAARTDTTLKVHVLYEARSLRGAEMVDGDLASLFVCEVDSVGWLEGS